MVRRPPRSTQSRSSAASDVYKRQEQWCAEVASELKARGHTLAVLTSRPAARTDVVEDVSYTHLRAHETVLDLVCRLLLDKKKHTVALNHLGQQHLVKIHHHYSL